MAEATSIYLNTWRAYNNGSVGYGWMSAKEAGDFIRKNPERDGGEWFIADIDNYLGIQISSCDYCNVMEVIESIRLLEELDEYEQREVIALMEHLNTNSAKKAIEKKDNYTFYQDIEVYHDFMDELISEQMDNNNILARYFDYEAYHRDCDIDINEMSNGVCIALY